jgi:HEAT repeat protein
MQHLPDELTGFEPALGGGDGPRLTGLEPILGGARRPEADMSRIQALIGVTSPGERGRIINYIIQLGQSDAYARELMLLVPLGARQKVNGWRGGVTLTQRCLAIDALGHLGGPDSLGVLLAALADTTYKVRSAAEQAVDGVCARLDPSLATTGKAITALVGALGSPSLAPRKIAARVLAGLPPEVVLGPLLRDGLGAADPRARREAAWTLGRLGDRRATARLIQCLDDGSSTVRAAAAWALGRLDAPVALQYLEALLADPDEIVRAAAVDAYGALVGRLSVLDETFKPSLDRLVSVLDTEVELAVRTAVLDALSSINAPEARIALHGLLNR